MVALLPKDPPGPKVDFPFFILLCSGGHNLAVATTGMGEHSILGSALDDSIGEAFDKTARLLGITQVPGGPELERLAAKGDDMAYKLPIPLANSRDPILRDGCDWSFAGLKTAVRGLLEKELSEKLDITEEVREQRRANVAASFQRACVRHLCDRAERAITWVKDELPEVVSMVVAGGVAANRVVRSELSRIADSYALEIVFPPPRLCVDNGVMIAWTGVERLKMGLWENPPGSEQGADLFVEMRPRWALGTRDPRCFTPPVGKRKAAHEDGQLKRHCKAAQT